MENLPFTLYFASTSLTGKEIEAVEIENRLFSFFYKEGILTWLEYCKKHQVGGKVILDSGAFSAWSRGGKIDLDEYIKFALQVREEFAKIEKELLIVNLDVIPGKKGETSQLNRGFNQKLIDQAAAKGFQNMLRMIEAGIIPIHVFHQGESFKWLDKMIEYTDYIGISPANDLSMIQKRRWIDSVFNYLVKNGVKVKTHGFAVTSPSVMRDYPWTSCDSSTWRVFAGMGGIFYPVGGFKNPDYSKQPLMIHVGRKRRLTPGEEKKLKAMLIEDGYQWEDVVNDAYTRVAINVRYFLGLERFINGQRKKKAKIFKIRRGFFN